jgi:hypothetical protein
MISYGEGRVAQHILLLRGINLAGRNRIAMPALRDALTDAGLDDVRTYLQSGNVVLSSSAKADEVVRKTKRLIAKEFGLDIAVVGRTRAQLAKVVELNPLKKVARNPKRYQVSFLEAQRHASSSGASRTRPSRPSRSSRSAARSTRGTRTASRGRSCGHCSEVNAWV